MAFVLRKRDTLYTGTTVPEEKEPDSLPALVRQRDLALLAILVMVIAPQLRALQFAGGAVFFYVFLAFVTLQLPSMVIFRWLARQAPARVPIYRWMLRLLDERWRSVLLFLSWWSGVLITLPAIGISFTLLQIYSSFWFSSGLVQGTVFVVFLALATFVVSLPLRLFRIILWGCGLCYLASFALLGVAAVAVLIHLQSTGGALPHPALTMLPRHFSWSLFGLAVLNMLGVNIPLFLDGEMHGTQRFLRRSTCYLWWAGLGALGILLTAAFFWVIVDPTLHIFHYPGSRYIRLFFGSDVTMAAWWLMSLGSFGSALAFVFLFSRVFLLAARQHYLPHALARLNRWGVPFRAVLIQSLLILGLAGLLLLVAPALLRTFLPGPLVNDVTIGDWFGLFSAIAGSLWSLLTVLLFLFALWLFWKKGGMRRGTWGARLVFPALCLSGCTTLLVCALAPFLPDWPALFFSHTHWLPMILIGLVCSLAASWVIGELPRRTALLHTKERSLAREKALREGLQQSYTREQALHHQLQDSYDEQQILMLRQKVLLDEVSRLYQEHKQMAMTDQVTGLLNHRTFLDRLEEAVSHSHQDGGSFLLIFVDLDHFKAINDTWGHLAGDAVLREVAARLQEGVQPGDIASRYGGEEFTLLLRGVTSACAQEEGERLCQLIHATPCRWAPTAGDEIEIGITASIGVAAYGLHGMQSRELLEQADQAMYQAKLAGRNCVRVAGTPMPPDQLCGDVRPSSIPVPWEPGDRLLEPEENERQLSGQALRILEAVLQYHDPLGSAHAARVSRLAEETGRRLGATPENLCIIRLAGLCHDLGKIGIPDAILQKAGSLNEQEWEMMQRHAVIGARILEEAGGLFRQVAPVVQAHHERWDGLGYPQGLKGEAIPLAARVISAVDAYDTMVSRRPYKDPMPVSAAEAELRRHAGTQFDPTVVQALLAVVKTAEPDWRSLRAGLP